MRILTVVTALAAMGYWTGPTATASTSPIKWWTARQAAHVEVAAIGLGCSESEPYAQYDCSQDLLERLESSRIAPESFIRQRCHELEQSWNAVPTASGEAICEEYLGRPFERS